MKIPNGPKDFCLALEERYGETGDIGSAPDSNIYGTLLNSHLGNIGGWEVAVRAILFCG